VKLTTDRGESPLMDLRKEPFIEHNWYLATVPALQELQGPRCPRTLVHVVYGSLDNTIKQSYGRQTQNLGEININVVFIGASANSASPGKREFDQ
jgi:hypothetical protein